MFLRAPAFLALCLAGLLSGCSSAPTVTMTHGEGTLPEQRMSQQPNPVVQPFHDLASHFSVEAKLAVSYCNFWEYPEACEREGSDFEVVRRHLRHGWVDLSALNYEPSLANEKPVKSVLEALGYTNEIVKGDGISSEPHWRPEALLGSSVELRVYGRSDWKLLHRSDLSVIDLHANKPDTSPRLGFYLLKHLQGKLPSDPQGYWLAAMVEYNHPGVSRYLEKGANPELKSIILPLSFRMGYFHDTELWLDAQRTQRASVNEVFGRYYSKENDSWLWRTEEKHGIRYRHMTHQFASHAKLLTEVSEEQLAIEAAADEKIARRKAFYATYTDERKLALWVWDAKEIQEDLIGRSRACQSLTRDIENEMESDKPWGGIEQRRYNELESARELYASIDRLASRAATFQQQLNQWFAERTNTGVSAVPDTLAALTQHSSHYDKYVAAIQHHCSALKRAAKRAEGFTLDDTDSVDAWGEFARKLSNGELTKEAPVEQVWRNYHQSVQRYQHAAAEQAKVHYASRQASFQQSFSEEKQRLAQARRTPPSTPQQDPQESCLKQADRLYLPEKSLCISENVKRLNDCISMGGRYNRNDASCKVNKTIYNARQPVSRVVRSEDTSALYTLDTVAPRSSSAQAVEEQSWLSHSKCIATNNLQDMHTRQSLCASAKPPAWEIHWRSNALMGGTHTVLMAIENQSGQTLEFEIEGMASSDNQVKPVTWTVKVPAGSEKEAFGGVADLGGPCRVLELTTINYRIVD